MILYAVVDDALSPDFPLSIELEVFVRLEYAERFVDQVRRDDLELAKSLRIEQRELDGSDLDLRDCLRTDGASTRNCR